jgi:PBS lyase HEAT-like repeat.
VREAAAEALGHIGAPAVESLIAALEYERGAAHLAGEHVGEASNYEFEGQRERKAEAEAFRL